MTIEEIKDVIVQHFQITQELGESGNDDEQNKELSKEGEVALNVLLVKKTLQTGNYEPETNQNIQFF